MSVNPTLGFHLITSSLMPIILNLYTRSRTIRGRQNAMVDVKVRVLVSSTVHHDESNQGLSNCHFTASLPSMQL
jgi:hypothetical protein